MEISEAQLQKFIELYQRKWNISLTPAEAQKKALSLLRFMAISVVPLEMVKGYDTIELSDLSNTH